MSSESSRLDLIRANRRGIVSMVLAMAAFIVNDAIVKLVSESLNSGQLIFIRGVFASLLVLGMGLATGSLRQRRHLVSGVVAVRAAVDAIATFIYLTALFNMPIGNVTAINLASPLLMTAFALLFMAEQVGWRRGAAILVGFLGVLFIVQPQADGFNVFALVALFGTVFHAARDLLTRRVAAGVSSMVVTLATAIAVTLLSGAISFFQGWRPVEWSHLALLLLASSFLAAGYYFLINATRDGEVSLVAPFRYSGLIWALLIGYFVWNEVPNLWASLGILLLLGSGLYVLHRERVRARMARGGL